MTLRHTLLLCTTLLAGAPAAAGFKLTFDDIPDRHAPAQYYNGGTSQYISPGPTGPNFGIAISGFGTVGEKLRLCPNGNLCGSTIMPTPPSGFKALSAPFETNDFNRTTFNLADGFTDEISFWIWVPGGAFAAPASVTLFANQGAYTTSVNPILGFLSVSAPTNCVFTTTPFTQVSGCDFIKHTITFTGTARSVLFQGAIFDDITIGSQGTGAVPEPSSWAMLIAGFGLTGAAMRRRRVALAG